MHPGNVPRVGFLDPSASACWSGMMAGLRPGSSLACEAFLNKNVRALTVRL